MKKNIKGEVIAKFVSKKGKKVEFRVPKLGDERAYLDFINSIIAEDDFILYDQPLTLEKEKVWLAETVDDIAKGKLLCLTAFCNNIIIGNAGLETCKGRKGHVAGFGITIKNGYREEGIGTKLMGTLFTEANKMGIKLIDLGVYSTNKRAINAYKKMGFIKHGILPKAISHRGKYVDELLMSKHL